MAYRRVFVAVQRTVEVMVEVDDGVSRSEQYLQAVRRAAKAAEDGKGIKRPAKCTPTTVCDATEDEALRWLARRSQQRKKTAG